MSDRNAIQSLVLSELDSKGTIEDTLSLTNVDQQQVLGVLNSLSSKEVVGFECLTRERLVLTEEGNQIADHGSHEVRVFHAIPLEGLDISQLSGIVGQSVAKFGQQAAFKNKWIAKNGGRLVRLVDSVVDQTQTELLAIRQSGLLLDESLLKKLKSRKLVTIVKSTSYRVFKGLKFALSIAQQATDIDHGLLQSGEWRTAEFKAYNFNAEGIMPSSGHLHPLLKVRDEFRQIFFEMGFSEMPSNKYVESSFWNFDALFQPQQHPARDAHDTFFLAEPATTTSFPMDYLERVKQVHSKGGYGSIGYGYDWKIDEASKLILRTHTTAISSNLLYQLAQQKEFKPVKWFSIDKVFRNETLDATHLAEFHQIEGVIADRGLTLGDLMGVLDGFFKKLGIHKLRFKPAYNPYTEPSMEIFAWHEGLAKWVEIGNSGMFRPEMLLPMGLPEDVSVIAWGLSTERPTMIKYGLNNIRDLVGHKLDLEMVAKNPICRLDK